MSTTIPRCLVLDQNGREEQEGKFAVVFDGGHSFAMIRANAISFDGDTATIDGDNYCKIYPAPAKGVESEMYSDRERWGKVDDVLRGCSLSSSAQSNAYKQRYAAWIARRFGDFERMKSESVEIPASAVYNMGGTHANDRNAEIRYKALTLGCSFKEFRISVAKDDLTPSEDGMSYMMKTFPGQRVRPYNEDWWNTVAYTLPVKDVVEWLEPETEHLKAMREEAGQTKKPADKGGPYMER